MKIFEAVKLCRTIKGFKQKELAFLAEISVSYLSLIERGKRDPNLSTLERIANALNISLSTLFFLGAGEDGLEKIDPELSEHLVVYAFNAVKGDHETRRG